MFTGLIREIATVKSFAGETLALSAKYRPGIGDSVAVNGACLTVTKVLPDGFEVELSHESRAVLAMENYAGEVHIEPAMKLGDRIEGHILQGHVDCMGTIEKIDRKGRMYDYFVSVPEAYRKFMIPKGSVAVDGVSLTINDVTDKGFRLTIIPHTVENTIFRHYGPGRKVNVETDMFARYLWHMFNKEKKPSWSQVDRIMALY